MVSHQGFSPDVLLNSSTARPRRYRAAFPNDGLPSAEVRDLRQYLLSPWASVPSRPILPAVGAVLAKGASTMAANRKTSASAKDPRRSRTPAPLGTVSAESNECIWMRAGVLSYRLCDRGFDCEHCMLDAALQRDRTGESAAWTQGGWGPSGYRLFPQDRRFSATHAWVVELGRTSVRIGVDALVAWLLSEAGAIKLPTPGTSVARGEPLATITSGNGKLTLAAPVSGKVLARNEAARSCPELVISAPYGAGWLVDLAVEPAQRDKQLPPLLCGSDMEQLSRGHLHDFHHHVDTLLTTRPKGVGATMADGGVPLGDPRSMLGAARYLKLVQELLL